MTVLFIFIFFTLLFAVIAKVLSNVCEMDWDDFFYTGSVVVSAICGLIVFFMLISIPYCRESDRRGIAKFEAFKKTIENNRNSFDNSLESATILKEIAAWNQTVAGAKFDNQNNWDWWTDDSVEDLEYIK